MIDGSLMLLALLFVLVGGLYASVGHAGASGYLAVMAIVGVEAGGMRPTALSINVLVASITFAQFARAGHFSWRLFWPFAVGSIPAAFLGAMIPISPGPLKGAIGVVLLLSAARMVWTGIRPSKAMAAPHEPALPAALGSGGVIGLVSGLTGTGGGIFLSPVMIAMNWADMKRTAATASLFILVNSVAGLGGLATKGWTPGKDLAILAAAACLGGAAGAYFGSRVADPKTLRWLLAAVLLVAGVKLAAT